MMPSKYFDDLVIDAIEQALRKAGIWHEDLYSLNVRKRTISYKQVSRRLPANWQSINIEKHQ